LAAGRLLASPISGKLLGMIRYEIVATTLLIASAVYAQEAVESAASKPSGLPKLAAPFVVEADGEPIDLKTGHAAPSVADLDGDGVWDLAVGEFGGGGCRLYKNLGTAKDPKFGAFTMLSSDGKPASMESS